MNALSFLVLSSEELQISFPLPAVRVLLAMTNITFYFATEKDSTPCFVENSFQSYRVLPIRFTSHVPQLAVPKSVVLSLTFVCMFWILWADAQANPAQLDLIVCTKEGCFQRNEHNVFYGTTSESEIVFLFPRLRMDTSQASKKSSWEASCPSSTSCIHTRIHKHIRRCLSQHITPPQMYIHTLYVQLHI